MPERSDDVKWYKRRYIIFPGLSELTQKLVVPFIELHTTIQAPIEICFDLSRSIDLHTISTASTHEKAIAGITTGLIAKGEWVTWKAIHFGCNVQLTSVITAYHRPHHFRDQQLHGPFKSLIHDHYFSQHTTGVLMVDHFRFQSPVGLLGNLADLLVVKNYLQRLLVKRNAVIKDYAETEKWKLLLS